MDKRKLTDEEIKALAFKIGEPIFKFIKKTMINELDQSINKEGFNIDDFVNIVLLSMSSIDHNLFNILKKTYKSITDKDIDMVKVMETYLHHLHLTLNNDEWKALEKKLQNTIH